MEKMKLTKLEKYWILYDVGNSAFILLASAIIPIYFNALAEQAGLSEADYVAYWGYAASAATLCVAFIGPLLGAMADTKGYKKAALYYIYADRSHWMRISCHSPVLVWIFGSIFGSQGRIFCQSDFL